MPIRSLSKVAKVRIAVIVISCILIIGILAYALLVSRTPSQIPPKEEIESLISELGGQDLGYTYSSSYIKRYGIVNVDSYKLNSVESLLNKNYYKPMQEPYVLAQLICEAFLLDYYDTTELTDKTAVTDAILKCMLGSIDDNYAFYRTPKEFSDYTSGLAGNSFVGIGIQVDVNTLTVLNVFRDSPAERAGMLVGDVITSVDGVGADSVTTDELIDMILGEEGTDVTLTVKRGDGTHTLTATRARITEQLVTYRMESSGIGYIAIASFAETTFSQFAEAVDYCENNGAAALIIDVRNNPGGLLSSVVDVIDYLIPDDPARIIASYKTNSQSFELITDDAHSVDLPITVICNGHTASAGELFTAAIRDFAEDEIIRATIVGTDTYGKGVVQTSFTMYDGSGVTFTIGYYNPPCNENFDGEGVHPDVTAASSAADTEDVPLKIAKEETAKMIYTNNSGTISIRAFAA